MMLDNTREMQTVPDDDDDDDDGKPGSTIDEIVAKMGVSAIPLLKVVANLAASFKLGKLLIRTTSDVISNHYDYKK